MLAAGNLRRIESEIMPLSIDRDWNALALVRLSAAIHQLDADGSRTSGLCPKPKCRNVFHIQFGEIFDCRNVSATGGEIAFELQA